MKANKIILTVIALSLSMGLVACNKQQKNSMDNLTTNVDKTVADNNYVQKYSRFYGDNISNLNTYKKYETPQEAIKYYESNEYPGNKAYVSQLKNDYSDAKTKIQNFIDYIKNESPTDNKELTDLNNKLITEGEKTISIIDEKLKELDNIPEDTFNKSKEGFIKYVNKTTTLENQTQSDFNNLLKQLNEYLGIDNNTNNTNSNK